MNFSIEEDFRALFPAARIGVSIARDIDNKAAGDEAAMLLEETTDNVNVNIAIRRRSRKI